MPDRRAFAPTRTGVDAALLALATLTAPEAEAVPAPLDDSALERVLRHELSLDAALMALDLEVRAFAGVARLRGTVPSDRDRLAAIAIASQVPGIVRVRDELAVDPPPTPRGLAALLVDARLTLLVSRSLLGDPRTRALGIEVSVRDRVVTLTGSVATAAQRQSAVRRVRGVPGLAGVVCQLSLPSQGPVPGG